MSNEEKYISHLNLILKVYQEPLLDRPDLFPPEVHVHCMLHYVNRITGLCVHVHVHVHVRIYMYMYLHLSKESHLLFKNIHTYNIIIHYVHVHV